MSPEAQRIAIAEACHPLCCWIGGPVSERRLVYATDHDKEFDPLTDLNAMHEAVKTLLFSQRNRYREQLRLVLSKEFIGQGLMVVVSECIDATAAQRAEAFLRTLGLWQEGAPDTNAK